MFANIRKFLSEDQSLLCTVINFNSGTLLIDKIITLMALRFLFNPI